MKQKITSSFKAKKCLGQNFLVDPNIIKKILKYADIKNSEHILEIGPGKGALTEHLSNLAKSVTAIEKDDRLAKHLKDHFQSSNVTINHADVLKVSFSNIKSKHKLIGNLPYNIATPIIEKAITYRNKFTSMYFTIQLEHAQRLVAKPISKDYGSLSCYIQYYTEPKILFKIKNTVFRPIPKVTSCFIELCIKQKPTLVVRDENLLFKITKTAFQQRRKTILNSLSPILNKGELLDIFHKCEISPKARAEQLSLNQFVKCANEIFRR